MLLPAAHPPTPAPSHSCRHLEGALLPLYASMASMAITTSASQAPGAPVGLGSALSPDELGQLVNFQMVGWVNLDDLPQLAPLYTELGHVPMLVKHLRQVAWGVCRCAGHVGCMQAMQLGGGIASTGKGGGG